MTKKRPTGLGGVDSLFRPPTEEPESVEKEAPIQGKPEQPVPISEAADPDESGTLKQTSVMLYEDEIDWLDQKVIEVRKNGGKALRKTALIRGLINLARSAPVDLKGVKSEEELVARLEQGIKSK